MTPPISCPACNGTSQRSLGSCPSASWAQSEAVRRLDTLGGPLYRCHRCDLVFRHPMPDAESLLEAYRSIPTESWSYHEPEHWALSKKSIARLAPNREVLDVGCFRGDFLKFLGPDFQRFGVEPNPEAAAIARSRDIEIIGQSAEQDFSAYYGRFGAIVLMDVIEHLYRPRDVLMELKKLLAPGGLLILFTGDACTWPVKISLPFHWYMKFPIHLVYLGDRHVRWLEKDLGFERCDWRTLAHAAGSRRDRFRTEVRCVASALWQRWFKHHTWTRWIGSLPVFRGVSTYTEPPFWPILCDHFWCVLRPTATEGKKSAAV